MNKYKYYLVRNTSSHVLLRFGLERESGSIVYYTLLKNSGKIFAIDVNAKLEFKDSGSIYFHKELLGEGGLYRSNSTDKGSDHYVYLENEAVLIKSFLDTEKVEKIGCMTEKKVDNLDKKAGKKVDKVDVKEKKFSDDKRNNTFSSIKVGEDL